MNNFTDNRKKSSRTARNTIKNRNHQLRREAKWQLFTQHVLYKEIVGERIKGALDRVSKLKKAFRKLEILYLSYKAKKTPKINISINHLQNLQKLEKVILFVLFIETK